MLLVEDFKQPLQVITIGELDGLVKAYQNLQPSNCYGGNAEGHARGHPTYQQVPTPIPGHLNLTSEMLMYESVDFVEQAEEIIRYAVEFLHALNHLECHMYSLSWAGACWW
ncbi:hypothetical protein AVEN_148376-1 [Araneus ventricosus]|uniref:Uncharacterized protein n=1 Tax=Araneus ventricosus TaxID=182803 RepID=A0A4Y2QJN0_ARAVE|nr:hypothetical protein AVEN_148376-1 [Araneus ventricosus]